MSRLGGLNSKDFFFSEFWDLESSCQQGWFLGKPLLLACCVPTWLFPTWVQRESKLWCLSTYEDTGPAGLGPHPYDLTSPNTAKLETHLKYFSSVSLNFFVFVAMKTI